MPYGMKVIAGAVQYESLQMPYRMKVTADAV
jgi:hypothetical protein